MKNILLEFADADGDHCEVKWFDGNLCIDLSYLTPDNSRAILPLLAYHAQHGTMEGHGETPEPPAVGWPLNGEWGVMGQVGDREGRWARRIADGGQLSLETIELRERAGGLCVFYSSPTNLRNGLQVSDKFFRDEQWRYLGAIPSAQAPTPAYGEPPTCEGEYRMEYQGGYSKKTKVCLIDGDFCYERDDDNDWFPCDETNARWIRTGDLPAEAPQDPPNLGEPGVRPTREGVYRNSFHGIRIVTLIDGKLRTFMEGGEKTGECVDSPAYSGDRWTRIGDLPTPTTFQFGDAAKSREEHAAGLTYSTAELLGVISPLATFSYDARAGVEAHCGTD